jgi:hypothetical protein
MDYLKRTLEANMPIAQTNYTIIFGQRYTESLEKAKEMTFSYFGISGMMFLNLDYM